MTEKLTQWQWDNLRELAGLELTGPMIERGWPAFPYTMLDMRSIKALLKRGLVECLIWTDEYGTQVPCFQINKAGRRALEDQP